MSYLFIGEDEFSKDIKLEKIKQEFFPPRLECFNFEILYSRDLNLKTLQEKLLLLPINPVRKDFSKAAGLSNGIKPSRRLILIKDILRLSSDIKKYLLKFLNKPFSHICLVLDTRHIDAQDQFLNQISRLVKVLNFSRSSQINAFTISRQIRDKRIKPAMRLLRQLLLQGEKPEKILGAIRYEVAQERFV